MVASNKLHRFTRLALKACVTLEEVLDRTVGEYRLTADAKEFRDGCFQLAAALSALGNFFHPKGVFLYHYTLKTHYLLHIGLLCDQISPRVGWCYAGEDLMMKLKELAQGCYT